MLPNFSLVLSTLLGATSALAVSAPAKRATSNQIYAYGDGIPGLSLYTGTDNLAYIAETGATNLTALTWSIDSSGSSSWTVTKNSTTNSSASFYVITSDGSYEQAGFVGENLTAPTGSVTTGFVTWGAYVMLNVDSTYISEFWVEETNTTNVWKLMWNQDGTSQSTGSPISLRTKAPST